MEVIKRNGKTVEFNPDKIKIAMSKAFYEVGRKFTEAEMEDLCRRVIARIDSYPVDIEVIQDHVENTLLELEYVDVFQAYSTYRRKRALSRDFFSKKQHQLLKTLENLGISEAKEADIKRENANVNGDTAMGRMLQYGSTLSKEFTMAYLLDKKSAEAHASGDIHIHDLDFFPMGTTTCLQIDLKKLYEGGFNTGHGHLRKPKHISSYAALAAIAIQSNQNDQHGGQAIPMFDYYMADGVGLTFVKSFHDIVDDYQRLNKTFSDDELQEIHQKIDETKDLESIQVKEEHQPLIDSMYQIALEKVDKATYKAMVGFIHNLNTMHSRAGAQVPFSSINFGTDTSAKGRMVIKNYLLALESGLGNHETPIFPIAIFKVKEGVNYNETDPNYDLFLLACKVSAKRMFPNFSFLDAPFNLEYYKEGDPNTEATYMGCRTRVMSDITEPDHPVVTGRGNLSFTTINLVRLGIKHGALMNGSMDKEGFFAELREKMDLVKEQLLKRFNYQCTKKMQNFPFLLGEGNWIGSENLKPNDDLRDILKHGTLTIGFIGLAECLKALMLKHHGESKDAQDLGLEIIGFMRDVCDEYMHEYQLNFSLIATPAEGLSGRFVKIDKEIYGVIDEVTDRAYYTNSFHVPVYYPISAKEKIAIEAPYQALTNGGHISYIELDGDLVRNQDAFIKIVRMMKESGIGYGAINHPIDRDPVCGFSGVINDICPGCNRREDDVPFERIRRITGYLVGTLDRFNNAKRAEVDDRVKHGSR